MQQQEGKEKRPSSALRVQAPKKRAMRLISERNGPKPVSPISMETEPFGLCFFFVFFLFFFVFFCFFFVFFFFFLVFFWFFFVFFLVFSFGIYKLFLIFFFVS